MKAKIDELASRDVTGNNQNAKHVRSTMSVYRCTDRTTGADEVGRVHLGQCRGWTKAGFAPVCQYIEESDISAGSIYQREGTAATFASASRISRLRWH
jgi:hypothetical protein